MSSISPFSFGAQPSRARVFALDVGTSAPALEPLRPVGHRIERAAAAIVHLVAALAHQRNTIAEFVQEIGRPRPKRDDSRSGIDAPLVRIDRPASRGLLQGLCVAEYNRAAEALEQASIGRDQ